MYRILLSLVLLLFSCNSSEHNSEIQEDIPDNEELKTLYQEDQSDRKSNPIDWSVVGVRDSLREVRVYELLDSNLVRTSLDYSNAAMIFQHGRDTIASGMAVKMMKKAIALDSTANKWLLAAAIDRDLMRRKKPQIYGTQYQKMGQNEPWKLYTIDTTQISDKERREYGVETVAEQREKVILMNKKKLSELLASGKTADEIVTIVRQENKEQSDYDLSEAGINSFGYQLMAQEQHKDALKIFLLNTELYPQGFNTYDSYGECLLKLGREDEAIEAYQQSLALNPENTNAEKVLAEIVNTP
jgi:tetratricopeptide (TPR) repeat protein